MNTLQNVYDKLADKTELAKHEVELGIVQDIIALVTDIQQRNKDAFTTIEKTKSLYSESLSRAKAAQKLIDKLVTDTKVLGIEIPSRDLSLIERIKTLNVDVTNNLAKLNQIK